MPEAALNLSLLAVSLMTLAYLLYTLLFPEKF